MDNHGFLLGEKGWRLSPAFGVSPMPCADGLSLNIDMNDNALSFELAQDVGKYFRLDKKEMKGIIGEVKSAVRRWRSVAEKIGVGKKEMDAMKGLLG